MRESAKMEYKYRVSVIVPVYNAQAYLEECFDSLVNQTIDLKDVQVVVVDDGSTDNSPSICKEYCEKYDCFNYFRIENSGVSAARNFGIKKSEGKYIMYLDSDDKLSVVSIQSIVDFFDEVYDEVDLVTYFIQPYKDGRFLTPHARYNKLLTYTGVFDLEEHPYVIQTTMNICVKNLFEDNVLFNEEMTCQEDQEYINRILMDKLKLGYCAQACYLYNRNNESSCVSTKFHAYYLFEDSIKYFEGLFARFEGPVPKYFQAVFFHDLRWKLTSKILFPFHYENEEFDRALGRIKALLSRVDTDIIVKNPSINKKHIHFWLKMKPNVHPTLYVNTEAADVVADGKTIERNKRISIRIIKINLLDDGRFRIRCECAMGIYEYMDEPPEFYVVENENKRKRLDLYRSSYSYVATNIMTNTVYGFEYTFDPEEVKRVSFKAVVDSYEFDVRINFMGSAVFRHKIRFYSYVRGEYKISYYNDSLIFEKKTKDEIRDIEMNNAVGFNLESYTFNLKKEAIEYRFSHRVWLYSDLNSVLKDNAYYQFQNDFKHKDGVERYYVYTKPYEEIEHLFSDEQKEYLVEFGSYKHQVLYLACEIIFTSFFGREAVSPFYLESEELNYADIEHFKTIYMQHGILHASYVNKYSAERANCDKIVVSSHFEVENLTSKYQYKDDELIKFGMPRYAHIDRSSKPKNKILFAPSWRSYFAANETANTYSISMDSFKNSDYYKGFKAFLSSEKLQATLERSNTVLDVKMHPIIRDIVSDLFDVKCKNINIVKGDVNLEDYRMFITDFSSFVFDFAYLCRPVLYFVPDYVQFKSGMNLYRELDLPFEKAFGPFVTDFESAVSEFEKIADRDFDCAEVFKKRMEQFYLPVENCEENIYKYVSERMV